MESSSGLESEGFRDTKSPTMGNEIYEDTPMTSSVLKRRIMDASSDISIIKSGMLEIHSDSSVLDVSNRESVYSRDSVDIIGEFSATPRRDIHSNNGNLEPNNGTLEFNNDVMDLNSDVVELNDIVGINDTYDDSIIDIEALLDLPNQVDDKRGTGSQRDEECRYTNDAHVENLDDFSEIFEADSKEQTIGKDDPCLVTPVRTFPSNLSVNVDSITSSILEICTRESINIEIDDASINGNVDLYATPVNAMVDLDCPLNGSFGFSSDPFVYLDEEPLGTPERNVLPEESPQNDAPEEVLQEEDTLDTPEKVLPEVRQNVETPVNPNESTTEKYSEDDTSHYASKSVESLGENMLPLKIIHNNSHIQASIIPQNPRLSALRSGGKGSRVDKNYGINKKVNAIKKKAIVVKNNAKLETMPIWIREPNDIKEIPSYIKMISNRLLHIERQIKKFCEERQGLLCSIWKLSNNGYKHLFPDPVIRSLTTMENSGDDLLDSPESSAPSNRMSLRTSVDNIDFDENLVNYNKMDHIKARDGDTMYWKASWLADQDMHTPATKRILETCVTRPINLDSPSKQTNSSRRTSASAYINSFKRTSIPKRDSANSSSSHEKNDSAVDVTTIEDPIEYFKQIDFLSLPYQEVEGWRKFFGIKNLKTGLTIKELERIRDYLVSYI